MRRLRLLTPLMAAAVVAAAAVTFADGGGDRDQPRDSAAAGRGDAPKEATVPIEGIKFQKSDVRVAIGGSVRWVNKDKAEHTSTSTESAAKQWDTGIITDGKSAEVAFERAGTFDYICTVHPFMKATVTVVGGTE